MMSGEDLNGAHLPDPELDNFHLNEQDDVGYDSAERRRNTFGSIPVIWNSRV